MVVIEEEIKANYKLFGLPVVGDSKLIDLLKSTTTFLICNWDGNVCRISKTITIDDVECGDKGCPRVYGCSNKGNIILYVAKYLGDKNASNPDERKEHIVVEKAAASGEW